MSEPLINCPLFDDLRLLSKQLDRLVMAMERGLPPGQAVEMPERDVEALNYMIASIKEGMWRTGRK